MNTVTFDIYNSYSDLGLILSSKSIGAAKVKSLSVDIPAGDGALDYTEWFGDIYYENRELSFGFTMLCSSRDFLKKYSELQNLLNGRRMKITLSDDTDYYYVGRVSVNEWLSEKNIGKVVVTVDAEPYKLKHALTVITTTIASSAEHYIVCPNMRKSVIPAFAFSEGCGGSLTIRKEGESGYASISTFYGADCPQDVLFKEGNNIVTITPSSETFPYSFTVSYREGSL